MLVYILIPSQALNMLKYFYDYQYFLFSLGPPSDPVPLLNPWIDFRLWFLDTVTTSTPCSRLYTLPINTKNKWL